MIPPPLFEEGLLKALENTPKAGIYVIRSGRFVFINDFTAKRSEYAKEDMMGMAAIEIVHPDDRAAVHACAVEMLRGQRITPYVFRTRSRTGQIHWITETLSPILYQGEPAILGTSLDITELVTAQNQVRELQALETSILEAIPNAVVGLSGQGIIFANNGVETVFGWKPEELVGHEMGCLFRSERETARFKKNLFLTLDRQQTFYTEFPCRSRDGSDMDCMVSASRITDGSTERKVVVTFEDITDRKRIGRELEHSRQRLRSLSAHLEEIREKERAHIARELHDELGQLLTALHMDLVLLTQQIPREQSALQTATASMVQLIDRIMTTLKRIYLDLRPAALDHLGLNAAMFWQAREFQKRTGIPCEVVIEPEDISLGMGRTLAVFRIFQETLTNVARHAQATRVDCTLTAQDGKIFLTVRDNGRGLSEEQINKPDSFGLLGIRERTHFWGGEIDISGMKGRGTTIRVSLPLKDTEGVGA